MRLLHRLLWVLLLSVTLVPFYFSYRRATFEQIDEPSSVALATTNNTRLTTCTACPSCVDFQKDTLHSPLEGSFSPPFQKDANEIVVLMWDNVWGNPFYWGDGNIIAPPNYAGFQIEKQECPVRCSFVRDRKMVTIADALLFDVCYYGTENEWKERPPFMPERREGQPWVWYAYEQKHYFTLMQEQAYMRLFDHKMVYDQDSFVQITYMCPWGSRNLSHLLLPPPPKSPSALVAFIASNCGSGGARERTEYVTELMRYLPVDSYGLCLHNKDMPEGKGWHTSFGKMMDLKMDTMSKYKFFLAFENNDMVPDYVTEKLITALYAGTVPVYRGAPNVDDWLPGPNSVIKASEFPSPKALAHYLLSLDSDDVAYNAYFAWKKSPLSPRFLKLMSNCVFFAECRLCEALMEERLSKKEVPLLATDVPSDRVDAFSLEFNRQDTRISFTDDFVLVPHSPLLDLTDNYTIVAWINLNMINDGRIVDKAAAGLLDGYEFDILRAGDGKGILRLCAGGNCFIGKRRLHRGIWYHVAASFSYSQGIKLYINGKLDNVGRPSQLTPSNQYPLHIGKPAAGANAWRAVHKSGTFDGMIDDVSIWSTVLTEQEISKLMFRRLSGIEFGLIAYWGMNEGTGNTVYDVSANKLHGSIFGQPVWVPTVVKPLLDISTVEQM